MGGILSAGPENQGSSILMVVVSVKIKKKMALKDKNFFFLGGGGGSATEQKLMTRSKKGVPLPPTSRNIKWYVPKNVYGTGVISGFMFHIHITYLWWFVSVIIPD